jgi:hypothetical protein
MTLSEKLEKLMQTDEFKKHYKQQSEIMDMAIIGYNDLVEDLKKEIAILKDKTREDTGSFKYDFCYDEVLDLLTNR